MHIKITAEVDRDLLDLKENDAESLIFGLETAWKNEVRAEFEYDSVSCTTHPVYTLGGPEITLTIQWIAVFHGEVDISDKHEDFLRKLEDCTRKYVDPLLPESNMLVILYPAVRGQVTRMSMDDSTRSEVA